jgi:hypothetical protein
VDGLCPRGRINPFAQGRGVRGEGEGEGQGGAGAHLCPRAPMSARTQGTPARKRLCPHRRTGASARRGSPLRGRVGVSVLT